MRTIANTLGLVTLTAAMLLVQGCGGCGQKASESLAEKMVERAIKSEDGQDADVQLTEEGISIKSKDGQFSMSSGENVKLPDNFPEDIPLYPEAQLRMTTSSADGMSVSQTTPDPVSTVAEKLKSNMTKNGWTEETAVNMQGNVILSYEKGERQASLTVMRADDETLITLTVGGK